MEGPYRDLGAGFARLMGVEGARRGPSHISSVEDALMELLRNARDASARSIYVASVLRRRRYRTLTVIDDGHGIPESHRDMIFEPGVTTRHLSPTLDPSHPTGTHGAGLSLYHIKGVALQAGVLSPRSPTSISATFDTRTLPERALQSASRPSRTNLLASVQSFAQDTPNIELYYATPASILATLIHHCILQTSGGAEEVERWAGKVGVPVSRRTVQRIHRGDIRPARRVQGDTKSVRGNNVKVRAGEGPVLRLEREEIRRIADILGDAARTRYVEVHDVMSEARPGEIILRASVRDPEEEYE